jgi:uncharacterized membrane protein YukC
MIWAITILSCLVILLGYTTYNLLKKSEKAEDLIISYEKYVNNLGNILSKASNKLKEIDSKGLFDSDDEIGWFFKYVKDMQEDLNNFNPNK